MTTAIYGYDSAYIFTHNMNNLEHIANNCTDTTKHTDVYIAQCTCVQLLECSLFTRLSTSSSSSSSSPS